MEPITDDFSLRKQNVFFVEMKSENCIVIPLNSDWKGRLIGFQTITNFRHDHYQTRHLDILSKDCAVVQYHYTLACEFHA